MITHSTTPPVLLNSRGPLLAAGAAEGRGSVAVQVSPSSVDGLWLADEDEEHRLWMLDPQVWVGEEHR